MWHWPADLSNPAQYKIAQYKNSKRRTCHGHSCLSSEAWFGPCLIANTLVWTTRCSYVNGRHLHQWGRGHFQSSHSDTVANHSSPHFLFYFVPLILVQSTEWERGRSNLCEQVDGNEVFQPICWQSATRGNSYNQTHWWASLGYLGGTGSCRGKTQDSPVT